MNAIYGKYIPLQTEKMAKLCKKKCVIEEADKFCREHGELLKCRDGHEILASSGLCKEDSSPPIESVSSNNSNYNADIQTILRGLTLINAGGGAIIIHHRRIAFSP